MSEREGRFARVYRHEITGDPYWNLVVLGLRLLGEGWKYGQKFQSEYALAKALAAEVGISERKAKAVLRDMRLDGYFRLNDRVPKLGYVDTESGMACPNVGHDVPELGREAPDPELDSGTERHNAGHDAPASASPGGHPLPDLSPLTWAESSRPVEIEVPAILLRQEDEAEEGAEASSSPPTGAVRAHPNLYGGTCIYCGEFVKPNQGVLAGNYDKSKGEQPKVAHDLDGQCEVVRREREAHAQAEELAAVEARLEKARVDEARRREEQRVLLASKYPQLSFAEAQAAESEERNRLLDETIPVG